MRYPVAVLFVEGNIFLGTFTTLSPTTQDAGWGLCGTPEHVQCKKHGAEVIHSPCKRQWTAQMGVLLIKPGLSQELFFCGAVAARNVLNPCSDQFSSALNFKHIQIVTKEAWA